MWEFETAAPFQTKLDWASSFVSSDVAHLDYLHGHASDRTPDALKLFRGLRGRVQATGLWGAHLESSVGGSSLSYVERVLLDEVIGLSRWAPRVFGYVPRHTMCARIVSHYGDAETRQRFLPDLWQGDQIPAYALNEPYVGSVKAQLRTVASRRGGIWVLDGDKWFIDDAAFADVYLVVARTRPDAPEREAFTLFLVPAELRGVELISVTSIGGQDPRYSSYGHIAFRDVELPESAVMGTVGGAYSVVRACRPPINLYDQGRALSIMRRCIELAAEEALTRVTRQGRLADFQTTQIDIGKSHYDLEQYRLMLIRTAWEVDKHGVSDSFREILAVKAALPEVMARVVRRTAHLYGALGTSSDMPFASWRAWADALAVSDSIPEACWQDVGKLILGASAPRHGSTWPADHIPTATRILAESNEALESWPDLTQ